MMLSALSEEVYSMSKLGQLNIGKILADAWKGLGRTPEEIGWGAKALATYTAPGMTKAKTLYPALALGGLGAGAGAIQQGRAAMKEEDPDVRGRVLKGALLGGAAGAALGTQYHHLGAWSAKKGVERAESIAQRFRPYAESPSVLKTLPGSRMPHFAPQEVMDPNNMYLGGKKIEGVQNILKHYYNTGGVKGLAKGLHEQAYLRNYTGRGGISQYIPNVLGGKLMYAPLILGGASAALSTPDPGDTKMRAIARNAIPGVAGTLTHHVGGMLPLAAFLAPSYIFKGPDQQAEAV